MNPDDLAFFLRCADLLETGESRPLMASTLRQKARAAFVDWRPIESAPKDTRLLLFVEGDVRTGNWTDGEARNPCDPTHWMPLPEPPK